jgi:dTDP-4-amino-4,6-dideoxygalactose transaminase
LGHQAGDFPVAERIARRCLSLPLFPELSIDEQDYVIQALGEALDEGEAR